MTPKTQETNFVFVGGPVLTGNANGIRSKVVQAGMREKRRQRRDNAVAEINQILENRTTACSCRPISIPLARLRKHNQREQAIKPGIRATEKPQVGSICCSFCGRYFRSYGTQQLPSDSLHDIGSGLDPTIPVNETTSRLRVHEIFSFASRHILPNLRGSLDLPDLYQTWAFPFDDDELKLYTFLWSSKQHEGVLRLAYNVPQSAAELHEQLVLKGLTLRALRKGVETYTDQTPIDSIIRCMLVLAVNDTETATQRPSREPSPFTPSFPGLHALEIYGSRDYNSLHWESMYKLLGNHGGIQMLRPFALAWQISVADLTNAAHSLRKPLYPMTDVYGRDLELDPPIVQFAPDACDDLRKPGSGFNELLLLEPPVQQKLVNVFSHVGELSYAMDQIATQSSNPQLLERLADSRDLVHHRLFSLPNEHDSPSQILSLGNQSTTQETCLQVYLACRLAVLLYATHVTFPIPKSAVVRSVLLDSLFLKLQSIAGPGVFNPLFLWCTTVALVALDETGPFAEILVLFRKACRNLHIKRLPELINLLHLFAWSDSATQHHYSRMEGYLSDPATS